jgi:hypothetical protein
METRNSRLLPETFDPPILKHGHRKILEPHGFARRPKSGDFKLLAAYVAAYVPTLIPENCYRSFVDANGERAWKKRIRMACDIAWRSDSMRDFDDLNTQQYVAMRDFVAYEWPFASRYFDGAWLIKWALRSTWGNRKKAAIRAEKGMYVHAYKERCLSC